MFKKKIINLLKYYIKIFEINFIFLYNIIMFNFLGQNAGKKPKTHRKKPKTYRKKPKTYRKKPKTYRKKPKFYRKKQSGG